MQHFNFHRKDLQLFGKNHVDLVYNQAELSSFINQPFSLEAFGSQMKQKSQNFSMDKREALVKALKNQYSTVSNSEKTLKLIETLNDENTFTVTTGHQLSLFTGPLYFVIKILQAIKQAEVLNAKYTDKRFVPVYWMATEDHDFEEIQKVNLFSDELIWESAQKGPVGRFDLEGLDEVKSRISELYQNHPESEIHSLVKAYDGNNLAEATRNLVHFLFAEFDLLIVDGDDTILKKEFASIMKKDLETGFSFDAVTKTNAVLEAIGGKIQVNPREINLFYIEKGLRSRIEQKGEDYFIDGKGHFKKETMLSLLEEKPECFSPNVVLRPLYQETVLPNLAYIGGGGEIAYWLQLKGVFDAVNVTYPLIVVRNSMLYVDSGTAKKIEKNDLKISDVFESADVLKRNYVEANAGDELDFSDLDTALLNLGEKVTTQITAVDPAMEQFAAAEVVRLDKQIEAIKDKLVKRSKAKHEGAMKQIDQIKERLFPNGNLQERTSNFFSFCPDGMFRNRLQEFYEVIDPNEKDFIVMIENESL